jgi:hypothetical protein
MEKKILFIFLFVSVIISCNKSGKQGSYAVNSILVDVDKAQKQIKISDVFDAVEYIPLETPGKHLIGEISQICFYEERFYILDSDIAKSVFCFDKNGKFLFEINRQGTGPGEYVKPTSISVNHDYEILLLYCASTRQVLVFDLNGNFLYSKNVSFYASHFSYIGNDLYAFSVDYSSANTDLKKSHQFPNLIVTYSDFKIKYTDIPYSENVNFGAVPGLACCFSKNSDFTSMINSCNDTVYHIYKDSVEKSYYIDFQNKKKSEAFYRLMATKTTGTGDLTEYLNSNDFCNIFHLSESDRNMIFIYIHSNLAHLAFYDKRKQKLTDVSFKLDGGIPNYPVINDIDGGPFCFPYCTDGKDFYSYITPDLLLDKKETVMQSKCREKNKIVSVLEKISEYDNPVIVKMTPKTD